MLQRERADREVLLPAGPKIALTGGLDFNDHQLIWAKLDQVRAKHPDIDVWIATWWNFPDSEDMTAFTDSDAPL